jgi:glutamate-1-semialdehyde 2,1-aminomutase
MVAGYTTLKILSEHLNIYDELNKKAEKLCSGLKNIMDKAKIPVMINRVGSMMTLFFNKDRVYDYDSAVKSDVKLYATFFKEMMKHGVYLPPAQFETFFVSTAHTDEDIEKTINEARSVVQSITEQC